MSKLSVLNLYKENDPKESSFKNQLRSTANVSTNFSQVIVNFDWLDIMEDTIRYLDNILRNPNRFIINEEEIVKIELARRITVESIRHLAKNTNLIQKIEDNGDIKPSKILNINKDESYDTYENRFIYTLINNMVSFIEIKKKELETSSHTRDFKKIEYHGASKLGKRNVNVNFSIDSKLVDEEDSNTRSDAGTIPERIEKLTQDINMLTNTEVFKDLKRKHVSRVIPPIKKTNLILKNTNFQYAMKLWDFLQTHVANDTKKINEKKDYEDNSILKEYLNETFYLNYLAMNTLDTSEEKTPEDTQMINDITDNLIERIVELNIDLPKSKLISEIGEKIAITKNIKQASLEEIQAVISKSIKKYIDRIEAFKW